MKFSKNAFTKVLLVTFATLALVTGKGTARSINPTYKISNDDPLTVTYLGPDGDYLLFEVTLKAGSLKKPFFQIEDKIAGAIYSRNVATNSSTIKFKIEKVDDQSLSFYLVAGKQTFSKSFSENDIRYGNKGIAIKY